MPGCSLPGSRRLRRLARVGDRVAAPVRYMRGAPCEDGAGLAEVNRGESSVLVQLSLLMEFSRLREALALEIRRLCSDRGDNGALTLLVLSPSAI